VEANFKMIPLKPYSVKSGQLSGSCLYRPIRRYW